MKTIEVGSDFSGIGAFNQSLVRLGIKYKEKFACDMDKYARKTFIENHGTESDKEIVNSKEHDKICDEMARYVLGKTVLSKPLLKKFLQRAEDLARSFSFYYPLNVNYREIPKNPLDVYMTSPPCQGFSMAGKRKGSNLFMNSLEFIEVNKPRFFIFENVKGLLSHEKEDKKDEYGKTFNLWLNYLGGKSVNGNPVIFPDPDSVPYHIYHTVLNAKDYGVPQNRERVFIIGIREDSDNVFTFPPESHLTTKLKDVLETDVPEKYYLSDEMIKGFIKSSEKHEEKGTGFTWHPKDLESDDVANCLRANASLCKTDNSIKVGFINQDSQASAVFSEDGKSPTLSAGAKGYANGYVAVKSSTPEGYEIAEEGDSINCQNKNSSTRCGRVGKEVASTLDTTCTVAVVEVSEPKIGAIRGSRPTKSGGKTPQLLEINEKGTSNSLTTVQSDNVVIESGTWRTHKDGRGFRKIEDGNAPTIAARAREDGSGQPVIKITPTDEDIVIKGGTQKNAAEMVNVSPCLTTAMGMGGGHVPHLLNYQIRRLTPRECIRLMNFPDTFKLPCSDTQTYKQAGNSIVVAVLVAQIAKFRL